MIMFCYLGYLKTLSQISPVWSLEAGMLDLKSLHLELLDLCEVLPTHLVLFLNTSGEWKVLKPPTGSVLDLT